jgi:hypothetical protein
MKNSQNCPGSGSKITISSGIRQPKMKIWRHLPLTLRDGASEWIDPFHHDYLIYDSSISPLEQVAEASSKTPDPIYE